MQKITQLLLAIFCMLALFVPATAYAATDPLDTLCDQTPEAVACQNQRAETPEDNSLYGPNGILTKATQLIALLVGIAAVIVIIIAGLQYILSSGDSTRVNNAKNMILYAVIGLIVAILAQTIVIYILRKL